MGLYMGGGGGVGLYSEVYWTAPQTREAISIFCIIDWMYMSRKEESDATMWFEIRHNARVLTL